MKDIQTSNGDSNSKYVTNNIRAFRKEKGLTQTELAEALGVTKQAICFLEKGHVSRLAAERIANYLRVSVVELMGLDLFKFIPTTIEEKIYLIDLITNIDTKQDKKEAK